MSVGWQGGQHSDRHSDEPVRLLFDSGARSGADVARALAAGADFVFCGRAFMFGLGALGDRGAQHAYEILADGLRNVMHQTGCERIEELPARLAPVQSERP